MEHQHPSGGTGMQECVGGTVQGEERRLRGDPAAVAAARTPLAAVLARAAAGAPVRPAVSGAPPAATRTAAAVVC